jgi:hypothetical protein
VTVLGEVTHLSTVEAGSFWLLALVGLFLGIRCVAICFLHVDCVGIGVVASVLALVVWRCCMLGGAHWWSYIAVSAAVVVVVASVGSIGGVLPSFVV